MIFIVGGSSQGKLQFAESLVKQQNQKEISTADGRSDDFRMAFQADIVCHMEAYIRRVMEGKPADPAGIAVEFVEHLIQNNDGAIVIADEIGYGIVPVSAFLREYREVEGRLCQRLAAASDQVYRVVCGIGMKIKG